MSSPISIALESIRGQLAEARRYTATNPEVAGKLLDLAIRNLTLDMLWLHDDFWGAVHRIEANLRVGSICILASPDVTDAAITLSLWELGSLASEQRKADEESARDAELNEAFGSRESMQP